MNEKVLKNLYKKVEEEVDEEEERNMTEEERIYENTLRDFRKLNKFDISEKIIEKLQNKFLNDEKSSQNLFRF